MKWALQMLGSELSCCKGLQCIRSSTPAPFSFSTCNWLREITTLAKESCWLCFGGVVAHVGGHHGLDQSQEPGISPPTKRLNSREGRWSLFFDFTLSHCPGSPQLFQKGEDPTKESVTIFHPTCVVAILTWDIEERVRFATEGQSGSNICQTNCLQVCEALRLEVLQWAHSSKLTCHPGSQHRFSSAFGGPPWRMTPMTSSRLGPSATRTRLPVWHLQDFFSHS